MTHRAEGMECIGCDAEACGVDFSDDEDETGPRSPGAHGEHGSPSSSRKGLLSVDGKYDNYTASFRHVVMFTFKETATEEERTVAKQALAALPGVVHNKRGEPIIRNFSFGNDLQNQPSNFDFAIVADFAAPEDYQLYRVHRGCDACPACMGVGVGGGLCCRLTSTDARLAIVRCSCRPPEAVEGYARADHRQARCGADPAGACGYHDSSAARNAATRRALQVARRRHRRAADGSAPRASICVADPAVVLFVVCTQGTAVAWTERFDIASSMCAVWIIPSAGCHCCLRRFRRS